MKVPAVDQALGDALCEVRADTNAGKAGRAQLNRDLLKSVSQWRDKIRSEF